MKDDWEILAEPVQPDAAIEFWKDRAKLTWDNAKALADGARQRAFYIAGVGRQDLVDLVSDGLKEALEQGETLEDFKRRILEAIRTQGWKDYRIETIFRTNMQSAYAAGRYKKMQEVKKSRPYWQYMSVMDKRTRPSHAILHEKIYPADHEFWDSNYPPNGFRCRCCVTTLSERQVKDQGLTVETEMPKADMWTDPKTGMEYFVNFPGADKGFRNNPFKEWANGKISSDLAGKKMPQGWNYQQQRALPPAAPSPFAAKPVASESELEKEIIRCVSGFTRNGPVTSVNFVNKTYFMATNSCGVYSISTITNTRCNNFNPARELKSAWNKIAAGKPLTFNEEYCIESLWHETVHNRQKPTSAGANPSITRTIMETVTQWVARRTYPDFLAKLGGNAAHQQRILKGGYGYGSWVSNFDRLLDAMGVADDAALLAHLENMIKNNDRMKYQKDIADYLFNNQTGKAKKTAINNMLKNLFYSTLAFESLLRANGITN